MCGEYANIDVVGEADNIPLPDASQDYVISSHVVEHLPDPVGAFFEWQRVLKDGGIVFMILPKPDAHAPDRTRPITTPQELLQAHQERYTLASHPYQAQGRRGHYYVLLPQVVIEAVKGAGLPWELLEVQDTDDKVKNGWTLVFKITKPAAQLPETVEVEALPPAPALEEVEPECLPDEPPVTVTENAPKKQAGKKKAE